MYIYIHDICITLYVPQRITHDTIVIIRIWDHYSKYLRPGNHTETSYLEHRGADKNETAKCCKYSVAIGF